MAQDRNDADIMETGTAGEVDQEKAADFQMGSEPTSATNSRMSSGITKPSDDSNSCKIRQKRVYYSWC